MKRLIGLFAACIFSIGAERLVPSPVQRKTVLRPPTLRSVSIIPRGNRQVDVVLTAVKSAGTQMPSAIGVMINGQEGVARDKAGTGKYVLEAEMNENLAAPITLDLPARRMPETTTTTKTCKIETVDCPNPCTGSLLPASWNRCVICLKLTCTITIVTKQ